jgi:hypothetical protein
MKPLPLYYSLGLVYTLYVNAFGNIESSANKLLNPNITWVCPISPP